MPLVMLRLTDKLLAVVGDEFRGEIYMPDSEARALQELVARGHPVMFEVISCGYVKPEPSN